MARTRKRKNGADAEWGDDSGESPPTDHNAKSRAETIQHCCREITNLEAERSSISEQVREIKQIRIKGELGMKIGDFNAALRLYALEGDDRDQFFDRLRETFEALGVGAQLDFIDALRGEAEHADRGD
jgi:hypothetical protein